MRAPKQLATIVVAAMVGGVVALGTGAVVNASATGSSVTYYGCLSSKGALSKVGTVSPPRCPTSSRVISWDSQGPAGTPGIAGATGATGAVGATGATGPVGPSAMNCQTLPGANSIYTACNLGQVQWEGLNMTGSNLLNATIT
ncbi:MAG: hypothetical protein WCI74_09435, partial [Actinomycetes bacterium]